MRPRRTYPRLFVRILCRLLLTLPIGAIADEAPAHAPHVGNPLLSSGPDPWVVAHDGFFYYTHTLGDRISLWKTRDLGRLDTVVPTLVWRPPPNGPGSVALWAPELHRLDGHWFLYYTAATRGHDDDRHRHVFVLENDAADPTAGRWRSRGMLRTVRPGIDGTVFEHGGRRYFVYSAYVDNHSDLVIAPMANPWTLGQPQVDIAAPEQPWEMRGGRAILEAPEFLAGPSGDVFLSYSASACWSDGYALGLMRASAGANLLDPHAWTRSAQPVFAKSARNGIYATGHNAFVRTADGRDWLLYHANAEPGQGCTFHRAPRIQPFRWHADGAPDFGVPVRDGQLWSTPLLAPH